MKKQATLTFAALAVLFCAVRPAAAGPITYTEQTVASGRLGLQAYTNALVTLTLVSDTTNVGGSGAFLTNSVGTFTVDVAGLGTATLTDAMQVFVNQTFSPAAAVGFGGLSSGSLLDTLDAAFASYGLTTSIGPITNSNFIRTDLSFGTTAGLFSITSAGNSTFTASTGSAAPEPASFALIGLGLAAVSAFKLRR